MNDLNKCEVCGVENQASMPWVYWKLNGTTEVHSYCEKCWPEVRAAKEKELLAFPLEGR